MRGRRLGLLGIALVGPGCVVVEPGRGTRPEQGPRSVAREPGPPPHAPAHGYRARHGGRDLVYDGAVGAYVVVGLPDVWFLDGSFLRWSGVRWEIGTAVRGPWRPAPLAAVPAKLRERKHPHGEPPGQAKKHGRS